MSDRRPEDTIRRIYAAFGRGDLPAIIESVATDVTWTVHAGGTIPYGGKHSGAAAVRRWFETIADSVTITGFEIDRLITQGDTVIGLGRFGCIAKATGKPYATAFAHVWRVSDGMVTAFEDFFDSGAAGEAHAA
jgi:ketosteroid isomerase-like protein